MTAEVLGSDPVGDKAYRQRIGAWVDEQWIDKDRLIDELRQAVPGRAGPIAPVDAERRT